MSDFDLTHDQVDALLRNADTPSDVSTFVNTVFRTSQYLESVEFYEDGDGVTQVRAKEVPEAAPGVDVRPTAEETQDERIARLESELDAARSTDPTAPAGSPASSPAGPAAGESFGTGNGPSGV